MCWCCPPAMPTSRAPCGGRSLRLRSEQESRTLISRGSVQAAYERGIEGALVVRSAVSRGPLRPDRANGLRPRRGIGATRALAQYRRVSKSVRVSASALGSRGGRAGFGASKRRGDTEFCRRLVAQRRDRKAAVTVMRQLLRKKPLETQTVRWRGPFSSRELCLVDADQKRHISDEHSFQDRAVAV